jgi:hypothetical protein
MKWRTIPALDISKWMFYKHHPSKIDEIRVPRNRSFAARTICIDKYYGVYTCIYTSKELIQVILVQPITDVILCGCVWSVFTRGVTRTRKRFVLNFHSFSIEPYGCRRLAKDVSLEMFPVNVPGESYSPGNFLLDDFSNFPQYYDYYFCMWLYVNCFILKVWTQYISVLSISHY